MKLYHGTNQEAWQHIQVKGLQSRIPKAEGGWGLIYLSPTIELATHWGDVILEVETGDLQLSSFDDCEDWEILCWGEISPKQVTRIFKEI